MIPINRQTNRPILRITPRPEVLAILFVFGFCVAVRAQQDDRPRVPRDDSSPSRRVLQAASLPL